jgi:superfamily II DNA or RNA helicase
MRLCAQTVLYKKQKLMLKDVEWAEDGTYTPQGDHKPVEFFNNALKNSYLFDLELGYFNSAAINVLSYSFATFIRNGGIMRMAINHIVSDKDKHAIEAGEKGNVAAPFDITNIEELRKGLDEYGEHFFQCLAYLIQEHRIQIRIIKPKSTNGLAHTKRGQFSDGDTIVAFTGSANFTLGGFINNREEITLSFSNSPDPIIQKRISNRKKEFNDLMLGKDESVEYLSTEDLETAITSQYGKLEIEDLLDVEKKLKQYKLRNSEFPSNVAEEINELSKGCPCFPYGNPRDYQKQAYHNWKNNKQKGLFAMATGTGKTLTALNCLLHIYKVYNFYKAVILVPTITLVDQWEQECKKFNFKGIIKVTSKNKTWRQELDTIKTKEAFNFSGQEPSYIVISTYASFARENVFNDLMDFPQKTLRQILLIADEAHNMGAGRILDRLDGVRYIRRIGLSATPERQFDEKGNKALMKFFGCTDDKYTFEFSMQEAIDKGYLCRYDYYPHLVHLTYDEMDEYLRISRQLCKFFNKDSGGFNSSEDILMRLLLKRKRIIHKAANKEDVFRQIMEQRYKQKGNLKYTLVYVPEGNHPDDYNADKFIDSESVSDDNDSDRIINTYTEMVRDISPTTTVKKFTSGIKERNSVLEDFSSGKLEVLTSMKCLDEGVDVPRSEMAVFCASTGNPRQFIQRRGRILRKHPDKHKAEIHDLVVAPVVNSTDECFSMEQSLLRSELKRVRDFATMSENADYAYNELNEVLTYYGLSLF